MFLVALNAATVTYARAEGPDSPLFSAFKKFCVETKAQPNSINAAIKAAGGKIRSPTATTHNPMLITSTSWDITESSERMLINAAYYETRRGPGGPGKANHDCEIIEFLKDIAGIEAVSNWVGVPPYDMKEGWPSTDDKWQTHYNFYFLWTNDTRWKPKSREEQAAAEASGKAWSIYLSLSAKSTSLQLTHILGPAN